jgi:hypothetical protein
MEAVEISNASLLETVTKVLPASFYSVTAQLPGQDVSGDDVP